jgi:ABC-type transporter Mla MlaB component
MALPSNHVDAISMPTTRRSGVSFVITGPIAPTDMPGVYTRVCALLERNGSAAAFVSCDIRGVNADAVTVDALARIQLAARRHGCRVRLRGVSDELRQLVAFMGLRDALQDCGYDSRRAGRPKSGNSRPVSRKKVNSTI